MDVSEDLEFNCPYCMAVNSLQVDKTGGQSQVFITDCETCCRPMEIEIDIDSDGYVSFVAKREGEG